MDFNGSDNVDEWSDDGGERMWQQRWMQLTMKLGEKANAVTTQVKKVKRDVYNVYEGEYM